MVDVMQQARERLAAVYRSRGYSDRLALLPGTCRMSEAAVSAIADALRAAAGAEPVVTVDESIKPVAWVEKTPKGYTRMWSHSLEAWTRRPADPEPLFDKAAIEHLTSSRDFYRLRCERLQAVQVHMRDPERKAVCDILANGDTRVFDTSRHGVSHG